MSRLKNRMVCDKCILTKNMKKQNVNRQKYIVYEWSVRGYIDQWGFLFGKCCLACPLELEHLMSEGETS